MVKKRADMKVLISAKLNPDGVAVLREFKGIDVHEIAPVNGDELVAKLKGCQALIVRSESKVTADIINKAPELKVIGRAGTGFDNIDAKAAAAKAREPKVKGSKRKGKAGR